MDSDENAWNYQEAVLNLNDSLTKMCINEKLILCKSVACIVEKGLLGSEASGEYKKPPFGYFKAPEYYVAQKKWEDYVIDLALYGKTTKRDQISIDPSFKFKGERIVGIATGYYIGNNILVTSGHVAVKGGGLDAPAIEDHLFIFGLTKDKYVDQGQGAPNPIPLGNIWEFDRILYCQRTGGGMDYKGFAVPESDYTDWALVLIKPYNNHTFSPPPALAIFPPQESYKLLNGPQDIFIAGHPMGTALKLSVPPPVGKYRGELKFGFWPSKSDYQEYVGALRHNVLTQRGNSGSPLFCKFNNSNQYEVVGTMQSSVGIFDLHAAGFHYGGDSVVKQIRPATPPSYHFFFRAARNELWYYLVNRQSCLFVILELANPNEMAGVLQLGLLLEDDQNQKYEFNLIGLRNLPERQKLVFNFSDTVTKSTLLPCHTKSIRLTYLPSSGQVTQQAKGRRGAPNKQSPDTPWIIYLAVGFGHPRMLSDPKTGKHFPVLLHRHAKFTTTPSDAIYVPASQPFEQPFQFNLPHSVGLYEVEDPSSANYDKSVSIDFQKTLSGK